MIAFLFPGQGSQAVGMGRGFYDASPAARAIFDEANDALGFDLARLAFDGPEAELALTANTQPAVLTVSVADPSSDRYMSSSYSYWRNALVPHAAIDNDTKTQNAQRPRHRRAALIRISAML